NGYVEFAAVVLPDGLIDQVQMTDAKPPGIFWRLGANIVSSMKFSPSTQSTPIQVRIDWTGEPRSVVGGISSVTSTEAQIDTGKFVRPKAELVADSEQAAATKAAAAAAHEADVDRRQAERAAQQAAAAQAEKQRAIEKLNNHFIPVPAELESVALIDFDPAAVAALRQRFIAGAARSNQRHEKCYADAFEQVLSATYWRDLKHWLDFANIVVAGNSAYAGVAPLTEQSATQLCNDTQFVDFMTTQHGERLCQLVGPGKQRSYLPGVANLGMTPGGNACRDTTFVQNSEYDQCTRSSRRSGFGIHPDADSFCKCSAQLTVRAFEEQGWDYSSGTITRAASQSRSHCLRNLR
ncbi:MAG: hypothetical protein AAF993_21850, partial [Pseudomonadota bacterium]